MEKKIKTVIEARQAFIAEYGSLARALNPAAKAYDGYKFEEHDIQIGNEKLEAFVASDTQKTTTFVVPTDGSTPLIVDYGTVTIVE